MFAWRCTGSPGLHGGMSVREASRGSVCTGNRKMLAYWVPPGYRRRPRRRKLSPAMLEATARSPGSTHGQAFERLRDEHGLIHDGQGLRQGEPAGDAGDVRALVPCARPRSATSGRQWRSSAGVRTTWCWTCPTAEVTNRNLGRRKPFWTARRVGPFFPALYKLGARPGLVPSPVEDRFGRARKGNRTRGRYGGLLRRYRCRPSRGRLECPPGAEWVGWKAQGPDHRSGWSGTWKPCRGAL